MTFKPLHRRTFLRGAFNIAIGLPMLEVMASRAHAALASRKRFITFFTPNGKVKAGYKIDGVGYAYQLPAELAPLSAFKNDLILLSGVDNLVALNTPDPSHPGCMGTMLTGIEVSTRLENGQETYDLGGGISIDQAIASHFYNEGLRSRFRSLNLAVESLNLSDIYGAMSYNGRNNIASRMQDPYQAFQEVFAGVDFGSGSNEPNPLAAVQAQRRSLLDFVKEDIVSLNKKLSTIDKKRLDEHLTAIRAIETRMNYIPSQIAECAKPATPANYNEDYLRLSDPGSKTDFQYYPDIGRSMLDILGMAIVCDLTRVASIQWSRSVGNVKFSWLPGFSMTDEHHEMSHSANEHQSARDKLFAIHKWYAEQFRYLLTQLSYSENGQRILDNTVVLWCNELGDGDNHEHRDIPWVLAGSGGGYFKPGRHLNYIKNYGADGIPNGISHNNLLVALQKSMGVANDAFGNAVFCNRPMLELADDTLPVPSGA